MRLIVLLLASLCYDAPSLTRAKAQAQANIRITPRKLGRLTKRQDDLGYLEQCSILQFWDKQIGRVNVLGFFDSTWPFSHRQAAMLKVLRERFDKTGFESVQFLAINAAPGESEYASRAEIQLEEETWRQISPSEAEGLPAIEPSAEALAAALGPDVYFIQDSSQLQIWPKLRAFRDQILVIDRCGRLTYQVIVPWSILHFPYVKAAILSTYKDEPCGRCEFRGPFDYSSEPSSEAPTAVGQTERDEQDGRASSEESTTTAGGSERPSPELPLPRPGDVDGRATAPAPQLGINEEPVTAMPGDELPSYTAGQTAALTDRPESSPTGFYPRDEDHSNVTGPRHEDVDESGAEGSTIGTRLADEGARSIDEAANCPGSSAERRLEEPRRMDGLEARDGSKSRSTNARSVSASGASDDRLRPIQPKSEATSEATSEAASEASLREADYLLPIRIIMRAPHVDEYSDRSLEAHEYLVLKTGQPHYHEHLDSGHEHEPVRKRAEGAEAVKSSFARDESPGLYGELADYWQNYANEHAHDGVSDSSSDLQDDHREHVLEQEQSFPEASATFTPSSLPGDHTKALESDNQQHYDDHSTSYEDADVIDEEAKSKLIAHYSKLLPWLYYVLAK